MNRLGSLLAAALASLCLTAEDSIVSGPLPGTPLAPVRVFDGQGPFRGQEFDAAAAIGNNPGALLFVNSATRNTYPVIKGIDQLAGQHALYGFRAFIIYLSDDRTAAEHRIRMRNGEPTGGHKFSVTGKFGALHLETPIMLSLDGLDGPGNYALNRRAVLTLVLVNEGQVLRSFTYTDTGEHDLPLLRERIKETLAPLPDNDNDRRRLREQRLPDEPDSLRRLALQYQAFWGRTDNQRHPMLSLIEEVTGPIPSPDQALRRLVESWLPTDPNALRDMAKNQAAELFDLQTRLFAAKENRLPYTTMKTAALRRLLTRGAPQESEAISVSHDTSSQNTIAPPKPQPRERPSQAAVPTDPELKNLLRSLLRKTNSESTNQQLIAAIKQRATQSTELQNQCRAMLELLVEPNSRYGNPHAKALAKHYLETSDRPHPEKSR